MTTRARLRYFDDTGTERIIGRINETGGGSINEFTLRNSGTQYTKSTIVSSKELFGSFPTEASQVTEQNNASGPEIFVDVYDNVNGTWKTRDRVYAESQGVVNNDGSLKHKRLYGFEKYTGKQKVNISTETGADASPVTTNIVEALQAVLPTGYEVDAPGDVSIPTVENYTFIGERSQAYKELRENYEWLIFFTSETDGSGNYLVRFQPLGYGGQVDTFEKGVDPLFFNKWTKDDELRRITEAEVVGTDSEDKTVKATASTNPNDGRFIRRNVGYLQSDTEAQNIAENLIAADNDGDPPESVEHGKITVPLDQPPANNLNASVQVINSELNIDDRFTVVEQTDYFHQSQVEYSFEFEKELTNRDQQDKKDLKNRNAELVTSDQTDVGNQSINDNTGGGSATLKRDQDVAASGSSTDTSKQLRRNTNTGIDNDGGSSVISSTEAAGSEVLIFGGDATNFQSLISNLSGGSESSAGATLYYTLRIKLDGSPSTFAGEEGLHRVKVTSDDNDIPNSNGRRHFTFHDPVDSNGDGSADFYTTDTVSGSIHIPYDTDGKDYDLEFGTEEDVKVKSFAKIAVIDEHDHGDNIEIEDEDGTQKPVMVKSTTANANITSQPKFTEDGTHVHTIDVTTKEEIINIIQESKTNR